MASEILGLFTTPEQYQLAQQQAQEAQAIQYANLNPMARANYGTFRAGQQLGGAIGGALGGEDPQLKLISQRQQLASQLNPNDPNSYMKIAEIAAQSGDQQFAIAVADAGRQAAVQVAQANKERQMAVPADIQKAQMIPQIQDAIDQYSAMPQSPERDRAIRLLQNQMKVLVGDKTATVAAPLQVASRIAAINQQLRTLDPNSVEAQDLIAERTQLQRPEKPETKPSVGSDREGLALTMFDKNFYDLTPEQRAKVNEKADAKAAANVPKVEVNLKDPTATAKANLDVMGKWEGFLKSGGDVEVANRYKSVISAVAMANAGNPTADGALLYNIAKMYDPSGAVQEGDKKSITGNPAIPERFKLLVQGVLNGGSFTPTQRKDLEKIANEIVKNRESQLNVYRKQYVGKVKALGGAEEDILNPYQNLIKAPMSNFIMQTPNNNPQGITGGRR
jgi:hypothetical protein